MGNFKVKIWPYITKAKLYFKYGSNPASVCLFSSFSQYNDKYSPIIDYKNIDGVLGIWTRDRRMVGEDKSTELWRPPTELKLTENKVLWNRPLVNCFTCSRNPGWTSCISFSRRPPRPSSAPRRPTRTSTRTARWTTTRNESEPGSGKGLSVKTVPTAARATTTARRITKTTLRGPRNTSDWWTGSWPG